LANPRGFVVVDKHQCIAKLRPEDARVKAV
jgi:hypothetical protein